MTAISLPPLVMPKPSIAPSQPSWVERRRQDLTHLSGLTLINENASYYRELLAKGHLGGSKSALERFGTLKNLDEAREIARKKIISYETVLPVPEGIKKWGRGALLASALSFGGIGLGVISGDLDTQNATQISIYAGAAILAGGTILFAGSMAANVIKVAWNNWTARREYSELDHSWRHLRAIVTQGEINNWLDQHPERELEVLAETHRRLIEEQGRWKIQLGRTETEIQEVYRLSANISSLHPSNRVAARASLEQKYDLLYRRRTESRTVIAEFDREIERLKIDSRDVLLKWQIEKLS